LHKSCNIFEDGAFAGTIGSDQAMNLPMIDTDADIVQRGEPAKAGCEVFDFKNRHFLVGLHGNTALKNFSELLGQILKSGRQVQNEYDQYRTVQRWTKLGEFPENVV